MSKLSEKFAAGKKAVAEREAERLAQAGATVDENKEASPAPSPFVRAAGPSHGSVSVMKMELMRTEIETLRASNPILKVNPTQIVRSKWANRHELSFTDDSFKKLKEEIQAASGNIQPIKVRPLIDETGKYEIVFGHRRHQACLELGLEVLAMVEDLNEQQLFTQMDRENRQRKDLRPYEQGLMYQRALDEGLFASARKMAEAIGVDVGNLSKATSIAKLHSDVLNAFKSPLDIQLAWGPILNQSLQKDADIVLARAKELRLLEPRLQAKKVLDHLVEGGVVSNNTLLPVKFVKLHLNGKSGETGSINMDRSKRTLVVNLKNIAPTLAEEIQLFIQKRIGNKA
jgi:ParB family chromosome partitioning protein